MTSDSYGSSRQAAKEQGGAATNMLGSAGGGALDSLIGFVHGDAIDMKMRAHFVCAKGDALDIYRKPFAGHWFPGNVGDAGTLNTAILFPNQQNFATIPLSLLASGVPNGPLYQS
jgi:hypothetical protein